MVFKINLVALRWIRSNLEIFLDVSGDHTTLQHSSCDLTWARYRVLNVETSWNPLQVLLIRPRILLSLFDILSIWVLQDRLQTITKPRSPNSGVSSRILLFKGKSEWIGVFLLVICISLIFFTLNSMRFYWLHAYKLSRSDWNTEWSAGQFIILDVLQSSAYNGTVSRHYYFSQITNENYKEQRAQ